ncbi:MAG: hypothetical protein ACD_63C00146G0008 [uncultured bacterium]|nr:MAG: hypothetical protein ACD_63C00146G0008 [uncultured bacterium]
MNNNSGDGAGNFMVGLLMGVVVGGALGLLYAPQSGKETRKLIRKKALEAKEKALKGIETAKEEAMDLKEKAGKAVKAAEREFKKN